MKYLFAFALLLLVGNVRAQFEEDLDDLRYMSYDVYTVDEGKAVVEMATKLIAQKPDMAELYELRAWGYEQFDTLNAKADFSKAIELDPTNTNALIGLGNILSEQGELEKSLELYQLGLDNGGPDGILLNMASVYEELGDLEKWEEASLRLINNGEDAMLMEYGHLNLAQLYQQKGELEKALENYTQACLVGTPEGNYLYQMGVILIELDRVEEACQYLNEVKGTESFEYGCCKDIDAVLEEHCK